jgi:hypothetical protein
MAQELKVRADAVEWRKVEGEIVALDLRSSIYLAINRSGTLLWPALVEGATREELVRRLQDEWDLDEDAARSDVESFIAKLDERDLLEA